MAPDYSGYTYAKSIPVEPTLSYNAIRKMEEMLRDHDRIIAKERDMWMRRYYDMPPVQMRPECVDWSNDARLFKRKEEHYCNEIPERMVPYYKQLLDYYTQAGFKKRENEKLCCALKRLGIKYGV